MHAGDTGRTPAPDAPAAPLKVFLLGGFEVVRDDTPIPRESWRRRRPADLLKLAALTPGRVLTREQVIETLWPDKDPASGANNLHRALYDLRQILGGRWVDLERGRLRMRPEVWVDVDVFEAAAASSDPDAQQAAVALYRGDLSPEDLESPWLASRRAALRARLAGAALPLARAAAARGDLPAGIALLRRVLEIDPSHQECHRLVARLLAEGGRRVEALRQIDAADAAMRAQGAAARSPELQQLRDAIVRGDLGPPQARLAYDGYRRAARRLLGTSEPPPLRGRAGSLLLFESLVEQGAGSLVLLGERGVGKTRLAVEGARLAQEAGAIVVCGAFDPAGPTPYRCFADVFADYRRAGGTAGQDPFAGRTRGGMAPATEKARLLEAVKVQLAAIAGGRPLYLLIDDLHKVDESSANLFHFLARSARTLKLMLVATCREDAVHSGAPVQMLLAHLDCERLARGVRVQRLDLRASSEQLADILGTPPSEALAAQFYRVTDGTPFYTEELARAFHESGHVKVPGDPASAVRERVARLGPPVTALLEAASVAGRRFYFEAVYPAAGLGAEEALAALERVLEAHIVDEDGGGYHFHHSLAREVLYAGLSSARRVALHRAIADALAVRAAASPEGVEDAAEELAHHRRAGDQPDHAFGHLVAAGRRATARAGLREANAYFEAALELADAAGASGPRRLELLEALGEVALVQAEIPAAVRAFDAACGISDMSGWCPSPAQRARARRGAALALLVAGRRSDARAQLEAALAEAPVVPGDERAQALLLLSQLDWHSGRAGDALEAALRCADEARRVGDPHLVVRAHDMSALSAKALGQASPADPPELATLPAPQERPFEVHLVLWENDLLGDRSAAELTAAAAAFAACAEARQAPCGMGLARMMEGALAARAGSLDAAEASLREALPFFLGAGTSLGEAFALDALAALLTARGRVEEAMAMLGEGVLVAERATLRRHALTRLHATLARNRLAAGAIYAAEDAVREASELLARHGECGTCHALFRPQLVRVSLARGRLADAESDATELEALAARRGGRGLWAVARQVRGRVLAAQGRHAEAVPAFLHAAGAFDAVGARLESARTRSLATRSLRTLGGREQLAQADLLAAEADGVLGPAGATLED